MDKVPQVEEVGLISDLHVKVSPRKKNRPMAFERGV